MILKLVILYFRSYIDIKLISHDDGVYMNEKKGFSLNGYIVFVVLAILQPFTIYLLSQHQGDSAPFGLLIFMILVAICWGGFFMVQPNQAKVMTAHRLSNFSHKEVWLSEII